MPVRIPRDRASVEVVHDGKQVTISRVQDPGTTINPSFARTSRECSPFCIQPASIAPGVDVVGELEVLDYLQRGAAGGNTVLIIDSRGSEWVAKGTIPGSINIHYKRLSLAAAMEDEMAAILKNRSVFCASANYGTLAMPGYRSCSVTVSGVVSRRPTSTLCYSSVTRRTG